MNSLNATSLEVDTGDGWIDISSCFMTEWDIQVAETRRIIAEHLETA